MLPAILGIIAVIAVVFFVVKALSKKNKGESLGESENIR
jgi:hypothetical protein